MKNHFIIALKLALICLISVLFLSLVNFLTEKKIKQNGILIEENANKELINDANKFTKKSFKGIDSEKTGIYYYEATKNNNLIGYIISTVGKGYGGDMKIMIAVDNNLKILNMKLLKNNETPGIGKKAETKEYMKKFIGTNTKEKPFPESKNMLPQEEKDAITGATITFNGVSQTAKKAIELLKKEIKG
ncbi:MAG TPA: RnfABCDGE type electron transport complex subunit G [Spirochaetota bacterium]|nr:RnfABCDGE type electron transport complex subunit G [Spirochaetota bacterium]